MNQQDGKGQDEEERLVEILFDHKGQLGTRVQNMLTSCSQTHTDRLVCVARRNGKTSMQSELSSLRWLNAVGKGLNKGKSLGAREGIGLTGLLYTNGACYDMGLLEVCVCDVFRLSLSPVHPSGPSLCACTETYVEHFADEGDSSRWPGSNSIRNYCRVLPIVITPL